MHADLAERWPDTSETLTRDIEDLLEHWRSNDLIFSQTCGFPYRAMLAGDVNLVGTPVYDLPCAEGQYYSVIIAHRDRRGTDVATLADALVAYNDPISQSGWAALYRHMDDLGVVPGAAIETGSHRASAQAVADGRVDIAAIDALTWKMIGRWDGFAKDLVVLDQTEPTPALPFICARGFDPAPIRAALSAAIDELSDDDRALLGLKGVVTVPRERYLSVPTPPAPR